MIGRILTRLNGAVTAPPVAVEVHISSGAPRTTIVGLAEGAVREASERVRAAIAISGFFLPSMRMVISLSPADAPKSGSSYDLPIALAMLIAGEKLPPLQQPIECYGELGLDGSLHYTPGIFAALCAARNAGAAIIVPSANAEEAALLQALDAHGADTLQAVCAFLCGKHDACRRISYSGISAGNASTNTDFADVRGQHEAKRALEIAAAGGHNVLMSGPPGSGKSMLAERLPGILPPPNEEERIAAATIHSLAGFHVNKAVWGKRPFRAPHHNASSAALVGGGRHIRPGEISLAHTGVLFLDEIPEFRRDVLEALRQPMETGDITIARAIGSATYPARFQLISAMNPCPCGYLGQQRCRCTAEQVQRYQSRLSGPLLDRIDVRIQVRAVPAQTVLDQNGLEESSNVIRARVILARKRQFARQQRINAHLSASATMAQTALHPEARRALTVAVEKFQLSARAAHRIVRVARSIADLEDEQSISNAHIAEAIHYRQAR